MRRITMLLFAVSAVGGCRDPYADAIDRQIANYEEMAEILRRAVDPETMEQAESQLCSRAPHYRDVSRHLLALPKPSSDDLLLANKKRMEAAMIDLTREIARVRQLPGGEEFFERIAALIGDPRRGSPR